MRPEWTPCGIHKKGTKYTWSTDWDHVNCNACRRWARSLIDGIAEANGRPRQGDTGWPQPCRHA
jgi:hypothetical protein